jgi:polyisoprenoid-binding protein YceI
MCEARFGKLAPRRPSNQGALRCADLTGDATMLKSIAATLLVATLLTAPALADFTVPSGTYTLDKGHASLTWKVNHLGLSNYTARFTRFDSTITLDAANPENSSVTAAIDPASVKTDYPGETDFDKKLQGKDWLNAEGFPSITFQSSKVTVTGENTGKITGNLTFLGVTKPVTLDVTFVGELVAHPFSKKPAIGFSARTILDRSEFGFSSGEPNIGGDVEIIIEAEYLGQ